jgi:hypothetical protein
MSNVPRAVALCFAAGAAAGFLQCVAAWLLQRYGIAAQAGAHLVGALSPAVIHPRVVIGGLWALLFLLPMARGSALLAGLLWGLVVALAELLLFPLIAGRTPALLNMTALFALLLWLVWGVATALLLRWIR